MSKLFFGSCERLKDFQTISTHATKINNSCISPTTINYRYVVSFIIVIIICYITVHFKIYFCNDDITSNVLLFQRLP